MRRLTLILSDLYLPEESVDGSALPRSLELPALDWLLRFSGGARRIPDWRSWLALELGVASFAQLPVAQACARGWPDVPENDAPWLASPVHLEARLDHVRLVDHGLLRIAPQERAAWCAEFSRSFGPTYALHDAGECAFLMSGIAPTALITRDPARVLDADIGPALPAGPAAAELRRLGTEIEMWLHGSALNAAREQSRQRRISALWLWGGGRGDAFHISPSSQIAAGRLPDVRIFGADPFITSLARASKLVCQQGANLSFYDLESGAARAVVELAPMSGSPGESLASLEGNWFTPARKALAAGTLSGCDIVANDRCFHVGSRAGWKFWRRRTNWLELLAASF
jgi:hypothetical protein